jgi:hypothetical protein
MGIERLFQNINFTNQQAPSEIFFPKAHIEDHGKDYYEAADGSNAQIPRLLEKPNMNAQSEVEFYRNQPLNVIINFLNSNQANVLDKVRAYIIISVYRPSELIEMSLHIDFEKALEVMEKLSVMFTSDSDTPRNEDELMLVKYYLLEHKNQYLSCLNKFAVVADGYINIRGSVGSIKEPVYVVKLNANKMPDYLKTEQLPRTIYTKKFDNEKTGWTDALAISDEDMRGIDVIFLDGQLGAEAEENLRKALESRKYDPSCGVSEAYFNKILSTVVQRKSENMFL